MSNSVVEATRLVRSILERKHLRGQDRAPLTAEALATLQEIPGRYAELTMSGMRASGATSSSNLAAPAPALSLPDAPQKATSAAGITPSQVTPTDMASLAASFTQPALLDIDRCGSKRDQLNAIFRLAKKAEAPRKLGSLREQIVFASGNPDADLLFVGEGPGSVEEAEKKPFVGPAGQKLEAILKAMGLSRDAVYLSNVVKFRPLMGDPRFQGTRNRKPTPEEMESCLPFVLTEISVVKPKVIIALGATAAEGLLQEGGSIGKLRSQTHELQGIPLVVTYHPSYLLRQESGDDQGRASKRAVWEDMLMAMEIAGLPISAKQRGFFQ